LEGDELAAGEAGEPTAAGSGVTAAVAINTLLSFEDADPAVTDSRPPAPASEVRDPHHRPGT
jgi:hypothetical protein